MISITENEVEEVDQEEAPPRDLSGAASSEARHTPLLVLELGRLECNVQKENGVWGRKSISR
jgi:hypothetical protein